MQGKVILVTGANSGIGKETARELARRGATVVVGARSEPKGKAAAQEIAASTGRDDVGLLLVDLADLDSVRAAAADFEARYDRLDVLVNNAGLVLMDRRTTKHGHESTFGINHLGPFLLTELLKARLTAAAPARVVNLSSGGHSMSRGLDWDDLHREQKGYGGLAAYGDSKLCNILHAKELNRRWAGSGVTAYAVHPGVVRTGFAADGDAPGWFGWLIAATKWFYLTPAKGARTSIHCATAPLEQLEPGGYYAKSRRARETTYAQDTDAAAKLWDVSLELTGASP